MRGCLRGRSRFLRPSRTKRSWDPGNLEQFGKSVSTRHVSGDVQALQISDTLDCQIPVLLDKVVLHAADLGCREDLGPLETVLTDGQLWTAALTAARLRSIQVNALEMHGDEAARIFGEVHDRVTYGAHSGHLKLHLYVLGIEHFQQYFVSPAPVDLGISNRSSCRNC